jgi:hypothetical protein
VRSLCLSLPSDVMHFRSLHPGHLESGGSGNEGTRAWHLTIPGCVVKKLFTMVPVGIRKTFKRRQYLSMTSLHLYVLPTPNMLIRYNFEFLFSFIARLVSFLMFYVFVSSYLYSAMKTSAVTKKMLITNLTRSRIIQFCWPPHLPIQHDSILTFLTFCI